MANPKPECVEDVTRGIARVESEAAMRALGHAFGAALPPGSVLRIDGPLGAGKTRFVQGLVSGAGCDGEATSPTFTLVHEYAGGRLPVWHFDLYRLEQEADLDALGFFETLEENPGIVAVEWGGKFPGPFPAGSTVVKISVDGATRTVTWEPWP